MFGEMKVESSLRVSRVVLFLVYVSVHILSIVLASQELVALGGGCFWCIEAVFRSVEGVRKVESGYMGGDIANPTYHQVSAGNTGHAEVVQVYFDKDLVDFETILEWFWKAHDPTTMNRQGADVGTQYRSVIFYETEEQRERAERSKAAYQQTLKSEIVTEIAPAKVFFR
uniref:peptide-methionine (S)-S-oxide reductase n=2 Tax=Aplanochytrium stocchinoi TaxID=215587 RepID=A0A7S3PMC9_9STRA